MPLDDSDLDRIGDKMELAVHRAMETHIERHHEPLKNRLVKLDKRITYASGAAAGAGAVLTIAFKKLGAFFGFLN